VIIYNTFLMFLFIVFLLVNQAHAHSWLDCLSHDYNVALANGLKNDWQFSAAKTHGVCDGYPRNYAPRDERLTNEINTKPLFYRDMGNGNTPICVNQSKASYTGWRKMLSAKPGDTIYMGYIEDGHLSKSFEGVDTTITIYYRKDRNELKTVGDLQDIAAKVSFDDGKMCGEPTNRQGQKNGRTNKPCVQSFVIPQLCPGVHSFMWYWNSKSQAAYYSCFDVNII
jgi:hypothetical protein